MEEMCGISYTKYEQIQLSVLIKVVTLEWVMYLRVDILID